MHSETSRARSAARGLIGSVERTGRLPGSGGGAKASGRDAAEGWALGAVLLAAVLLVVCAMGSAQAQRAGARVALVIGNAAYEWNSVGRLENPVRDAERVGRALEAVGFKVRIERNLTENAFVDLLDEFARDTRFASAAVFYYAGHGTVVGGENYLLPVDLEGAGRVKNNAIKVADVVGAMQGRQNLVFLDSCRSPPSRRTRGTVVSRGLVAVGAADLGKQILIGYATAPGQPALDGEARGNSPYAAALAEQLGTPGLDVSRMHRRVRNAVREATEGGQQPWMEDSLGEDFYFRHGNPPPSGSWTSPLGMEFKWIPAGSFVMGSPQGEEGRFAAEVQHGVRISEGFWMGKYEVTQGEWEAVMGSNPSYFESCGARCPVESVSWNDVQGFIAELNARESGKGNRYRLPTEAEWEYAARAGTTGARHGVLGSIAWYEDNSGGRTHPVGQKRANAWGLHDMLGNVWEWTADWYGDYPSGLVTDPRGPSTGSDRVFRGGSWFAWNVRSANRLYDSPGFRGYDDIAGVGFRLVRTE